MSEQCVPASSTQDMSTSVSNPADEIRAAMSVNNLLAPSQGSDLQDPVAAEIALSASTHTKSEDAVLASSHPMEQPNEVSSTLVEESSLLKTEETSSKEDIKTAVVYDPPREFECVNDPQARCRTGQVVMNLSRKVISDYFGRNKACTRKIAYWPLMCRKHYQRATYNNKVWQARKLTLILEQFDHVELQFPGTLYNVALKKSEEARLNLFSRKIAQGMNEEEALNLEGVKPGSSKSFEAPIKLLRELEAGLGDNKTIDDVKETIEVIQQMVEEDETLKVPSIEFLPKIGSTAVKREAAVSKTSMRSSKKKAGPRVSEKGGVQKTAPKKAAKSGIKTEAAKLS